MKGKQKFGLFSASLLLINGTIGSGIFLLPGQSYSLMGTSSLIIYVLSALLAMGLAACFAEVGGMFTRNGGPYIYTREAFGEFWGFEIGIMKFAVGVISGATMAVAFTTALSAIWPEAGSGMTRNLIIVTLIGGLGIINLIGVSTTKLVNNIVTLAKLVPLVILVCVGIFFMKGDNFLPLMPDEVTATKFSDALLVTFYAFTGFASLATAAEDIDDPQKNIPKAIILSMGAVSVFYILIQAVCIGTMGTALANSENPIVDAMQVFMGSWGAKLVTIGSLISILGVNLTNAFYCPRGCVALAEDGMMPKVVRKKATNGVPYVAVLLYVCVTIPLALSGSFAQLAAINVISKFTQYIPTCLAVMVFRRKRPDLKSTFRIPFGDLIPILSTVVIAWLLFNSDLQKIAIGLGAMVVAAPIFYLKKWFDKRHTPVAEEVNK